MAASTDRVDIAPILELSRFRRRARWRDVTVGTTADLLSLRRSLTSEASIEIDDLELLLDRLDEATVATLVQRVRLLLDREFGRLRVHRSRRHFVARHRCMDTLIAGLLRAQFHAMQIALPLSDHRGERLDLATLTLTWGVGRTEREAEMERVRRRRQKRRSQ